MKRYTFYILIALLTFGISSFIALKIYWKSQETLHTSASPQLLNSLSSKIEYKTTFPKPFEKQGEKPTKPFCNDQNILPVWKILLKDKYFWEWEPIAEYSLDCKDMLEIKKVDLNQDGDVEILLRGNNFNLCSPVGNCAFWIFEKRIKNYRKILYSTDYIDVSKLGEQILKRKTNDYSDILLKGHLSGYETSFTKYKFNGKKYIETKCSVETFHMNGEREFITCKEWQKK